MKLFAPKIAEENYTMDMLPHTRKQVFWDIVKLHHRTLILCGLILFAFMIPLHLSAIAEYAYRASLSQNITENSPPEQLTEMLLSLISFGNTRRLIDVPLWILFFIGLSGVARVIRQYAWEENVYFRYEFAEGIKSNWKQYSVLGLLVGILTFVCTYIYNLSTLSADKGSVYSYLGVIPSVLFSVLFIPPLLYSLVSVSVYKNTFRQNVRMGLVLYARQLWQTVLTVICCAVVFIPQMIPNFYCIIIGRVLSSLVLPFLMLGWWLFAYNGLDKSINPKFAPELIGRGTVPLSEKMLAEMERRRGLEEQKDKKRKTERSENKRK